MSIFARTPFATLCRSHFHCPLFVHAFLYANSDEHDNEHDKGDERMHKYGKSKRPQQSAVPDAFISLRANARTLHERVPILSEGRREARSNALKPVSMPPPPRSSLKQSADFVSSPCDTDRCVQPFGLWDWSGKGEREGKPCRQN